MQTILCRLKGPMLKERQWSLEEQPLHLKKVSRPQSWPGQETLFPTPPSHTQPLPHTAQGIIVEKEGRLVILNSKWEEQLHIYYLGKKYLCPPASALTL